MNKMVLSKIFNVVKSTIKKINAIDKGIHDIKVAIGRIEGRQIAAGNLRDITSSEFKVFSQWGEDGIIQFLINNIEIKNRVFVEFGVQNYTEANTRYLLVNDNWSGLVIDGSEENIKYIKNDEIYWRYNIKAECAFLTAENINEIILKNGIKGEIGLLSIDIDGVDYWVWEAINCVSPAIVICEYNHRFGDKDAVTVPYDPSFIRQNKHFSQIYYGASIKALHLLGKAKGYSLVAGNSNGNNVFFVRDDLLNEKIFGSEVEDVFNQGQFRESRNQKGELLFLSIDEERELLRGLELINVDKPVVS